MTRKAKNIFALKWAENDPSEAIILSFHSKWRLHLIQGAVSVVFRKMGPSHFSPKTIYAYFGSPIATLDARITVQQASRAPVDEAVNFAGQGLLTPDELRQYAELWSDLLVYQIGDILVAENTIPYSLLQDKYNFYVSSTYTPLSGTGVKVIESLGKFRPPKQ
jgi:hypothetical protein